MPKQTLKSPYNVLKACNVHYWLDSNWCLRGGTYSFIKYLYCTYYVSSTVLFINSCHPQNSPLKCERCDYLRFALMHREGKSSAQSHTVNSSGSRQ